MSLSQQLLDILACPKCKGPIEYRQSEKILRCSECRLDYAVRDDDIPVMLIDEATPF